MNTDKIMDVYNKFIHSKVEPYSFDELDSVHWCIKLTREENNIIEPILRGGYETVYKIDGQEYKHTCLSLHRGAAYVTEETGEKFVYIFVPRNIEDFNEWLVMFHNMCEMVVQFERLKK